MLDQKSIILKAKDLLKFSFPIMLGNLGQMLIGATDVFVAARHGTTTVAAISIANAIFMAIFSIGLGLLLSVSPVLSKKRGEKQDINKFLKISIIYSLVLSLILGIIAFLSSNIIPLLGFDKSLITYIQDYIKICSFSLAGVYLYQVLKEFMQAQERVFFANLVSIAAIILNLILCWMFVFGYGFMPSLGVNGLAIAALLVRSFMGLALLCYCWKYLKTELFVDYTYIKELFKVGYPIALSMVLEFSAFNIITLIAGRIGTIQVAAHNIVLTLASITFMIPLAISNSIGVKIGYAYGDKNYKNIKENLIAGLVISLAAMSIFASCFLFFPEALIKLFSPDRSIITAGSGLLFVVALFQIFDGIQITISGALRGLGYTKPIMITMLIGYWLVGIPVGIYFAFIRHLQILGLWMGLAIALFSCSIIFSVFLVKKLYKIKISIAEHKNSIDLDLNEMIVAE